MSKFNIAEAWKSNDWNGVEFSHGLNAQATHDLCVVDFNHRTQLAERLTKRPAAKEALLAAVKDLKKSETDSSPKTIKINYEGKGQMIAVILMGDCSTFVLQTALRKAFAGTLNPTDSASTKKDEVVNLWIAGVKDAVAQGVLSYLASLSILVRLRTEVFGQRTKDQKKPGNITIHLESAISKDKADQIINEGCTLAVANNQVRYLADLPTNILNPDSYKTFALELAKELKVKAQFFDRKELIKRGAGAFLAVIKADLNHSGGIVHLKYDGKKSNKKDSQAKKIALVGKGLCFDTGGYNVKTGDFMYNMHRDMTGSAVALSLFRSLVELEVPYEVNAYLALAENLISHEGFKPNDVVMASNGMSIEVVDTDAEGRMVLSDTLVMASETKPDLIIDFATLTGSMVRALDTRRCGAYSNRSDLGSLAVKVGEQCGERVWNFPIGDDYNDSLKSEVADIRQCSSSSSADHIYAATFLSRFVGKKDSKNNKDIPWIHIDLAADTNKGGLGIVPTETTGFGVRFGYELIHAFLG